MEQKKAKSLPDIPAPPGAKREPAETRLHGQVLVDDYRWMRDKTSPEVTAYLEAENAYADAVMAPTAALQKTLYDEMVGHIKETDVNVPFKKGGYYYYSRWEAGKQYPIYARKKTLDAPEEITLDLNELAKGESYMALGAWEVSDDGNLLLYSTDNNGFRQYRLRVRDLRTGKDLPDTAEKTGALAWAADNKTLFYTVEDHAKRHYRLYRHTLGAKTQDDVLVYEEKDERFRVNIDRARSGKFMFMTTGSHTSSEVRYIDASAPAGQWKLLLPREKDIEYYAGHAGDHFYIRINDTGRNFRLVRAPVSDPSKKNWQELVPARDDVMLRSVMNFADFYVLVERDNGLPQFTLVSYAGGGAKRIPFPEPVYVATPQNNEEFETTAFRYSYQSLVTPNSVYDYDVKTGASTLLKQTEVPGYNPSLYESKRVWATARDGVKVPISIVYRKDRRKAGENPLYLYGYGSYGYPLPANFSSNRLSLLDRGLVVALAHIRGGGDLGKSWHDSGRMMNKMNTFADFIDCTEYLLKEKWAAPGKVVAEGGSAGGLLMGAICNLRPDLYKAVLVDVPFVDVMNTMLDASLPLTVGEYEEWGNPAEKEAFDYMLKYSPYDNLKAGPYPAMLVRTALNDSQVMYWEPAKYVAKLRRMKTDKNQLLFKTDMSSGHGGASGRYDFLKDIAYDYAFILMQLDMT